MAVQVTTSFANAVPASRPTYDAATIGQLLKAAAYYINSFVQGRGTLDYTVTFDDTVSTSNASSVNSVQIGVLPGGGRLYAPGGLSEWQTGVDANGATNDGNMTIGGAGVTYFFDTTLNTATDIPSNARDFFSTAVHESLHILGFNGFADTNADKTTYGQYVTQVNGAWFFNGPAAMAAYGGPVPLDSVSPHPHLGNSAAPLTNAAQLIGGFIDTLSTNGIRDHFTATELGVLTDLGYIVTPTQNGVAGTSGFDVVTVAGTLAGYLVDTVFDQTWLLQKNTLSYSKLVDSSVEYLKFDDTAVAVSASAKATMATLNTAFSNVLRSDPLLAAAGQSALAILVDSGSINLATAAARIGHIGDNTTSVATLAYEFFTGKAPSAGGMDFLVAPAGPNPNNLNAAYYQSFNAENRYINFAVNLGKNGDGKAAFEATYGSKTLLDTVKAAYTTIFGSAPTDAKAHLLLDSRADYFAYYGGDGLTGIGTKAAAVGWLLAEAVKADVGTYAKSNDAFLADVALKGAPFGVDLIGVYGKAEYVYVG